MYIVSAYFYLKYTKYETVEKTEYYENWDKNNSYKRNQYSDLLHGRSEICHEGMAKCAEKHEELRGQDHVLNSLYTGKLNVILNIVIILNCFFVSLKNSDPKFIIIYIQYVKQLKINTQIITNMYKSYTTAAKNYKLYQGIFKDTLPMTQNVTRIKFDSSIIIKKASNFMRNEKMALVINDTLTIMKGMIIYLSGESGVGKSTFFDIITGTIKHSETNFNVLIDGKRLKHGFEHLKIGRVYVESDINVDIKNDSYYNLIVSNQETFNIENVWAATRMAECDFITEENLNVKTSKISRGQKTRLKVARYMAEICSMNPPSDLVVLDEIADGVDPSTTIKIANNIFNYFRKRNITCILATHIACLQEMKYDMQINIIKGGIVTLVTS